jgi:type VI secretion system secreted protein VgrG
MGTTFSQANRQLSITTPLGKDVLLLAGFSGREEMSRLFRFDLDLLSATMDIKPTDIVGKAVTVSLLRPGGSPRYFNGVVSRFSAGSTSPQGLRQYRAEMVPWLWFLTRTADCRIFQNKSVPEVVEQIFKDLGFTDYKKNLQSTYDKWEYCVQYRETDFNFVSRLLEQEGIFYYFQQADGKHTLVLADQKSAYQDCAEKEADYSAGSQAPNHVASWEHRYELRPGKWAQTDYNFETPLVSLMSNTTSVVKLPPNDKLEVYDYPGEYEKKSQGDAETKVRMEEEEVPYNVVHGGGNCRTFTPGAKFKLKSHACAGEAGDYLLVAVEHSATEPAYLAGAAGAQMYANSFTCVPAAVQFRPARTTPKPVVQGPQTAVVVGPSGEEIYTDKYGRVRVQFFWDREGKKDEKSTCWIRVAQPIAGKRWGTSFWPRVGQEVVVTFLEGDPDHPLITGTVYNADQMPPYLGDGPDDKHKNDNKVSGFKSNTTKGGTGFNELRFDDTKDKQQVFIHAERDFDLRIKNERRERVFGNYHLIVGYEKDGKKGGDQREMVYQDQHLDVKRNVVQKIEGSMQLLVGGGDAPNPGNVDVAIKKDRAETIEGLAHLHVKKDRNEKVDGKQSLTVGGDQHEKVTGGHALDAKTVYLKAGDTVVIEASTGITLKVGGNFVVIDSSGVAIKGSQVLINSGGSPGSGSAASPTAPTDAQEANPTKPDLADDAKTGSKSAPG